MGVGGPPKLPPASVLAAGRRRGAPRRRVPPAPRGGRGGARGAWRRAAGEELQVVVCLRHPSEVVGSLVARGGMQAERAGELALRYLKALEHGTEPSGRVVVEYESFLAEPGAEVQRLADALGLKP